MTHGGFSKRQLEERRPLGQRSKGLGPRKDGKNSKSVSLKNQIRSTERLLRKDLPDEVRQAQEKKLGELKKQQDIQASLALRQKMRLKDKRINFFERRKIERMIRRLEKQQCESSDGVLDEKTADEISKLREDLNYVKFFPKTERYVPLFVGDDPNIVDKRNKLRLQIKANLIEAASNGKNLEETTSNDGLDVGEDDFFLSGNSSDEAETDDKWTDKSTREPAPSASSKATSGISTDERNQWHKTVGNVMPPPNPFPSNRDHHKGNAQMSSNKLNGRGNNSSKSLRSVNTVRDRHDNLSSRSDAHKPRRKRRPKKKKTGGM